LRSPQMPYDLLGPASWFNTGILIKRKAFFMSFPGG
jgi:hypothetical protein